MEHNYKVGKYYKDPRKEYGTTIKILGIEGDNVLYACNGKWVKRPTSLLKRYKIVEVSKLEGMLKVGE